jgi:hypothetical protein
MMHVGVDTFNRGIRRKEIKNKLKTEITIKEFAENILNSINVTKKMRQQGVPVEGACLRGIERKCKEVLRNGG